ncbi:MAG: FxsA family protein [Mycobacterium sp.]
MVKRLFLLYVVIELAAVIALAYTVGIGWTLLAVLCTFVLGLALAGSQLRKQLAKLRSGAGDPQGAATDSVLVALGTLLVFIPGLVTTAVGALMLMPPTRAVVRPLAGALAARGLARQVAFVNLNGLNVPGPGRGDYIDGEVVEVFDAGQTPNPAPPAVIQRKPE